MTPLPDTDLYRFVTQNPITPALARDHRHGAQAPDAYTRAVIVLQMLGASADWSDGDERRLDDCFEMGDGAQVVGHLLRMADADANILNLLRTHRQVGPAQLAQWRADRQPVPHPTVVADNVARFNRALQTASAFHVNESIFPIDDATELQSVTPETPDDAVVLRSPECDVPVRARDIRLARPGATSFTLPGGVYLGFFETLRLV